MSSFLDTMLERAKADKQTIVLPEGDDPRTLEAAETILAQGVANLIILGNVAAIKESGRALDGATLIDPQDSDLHDEFANTLYELRKHKGMTLEQAAEKVRDVLFFGVLMVEDRPRRRHGLRAPAIPPATCCVPACKSSKPPRA